MIGLSWRVLTWGLSSRCYQTAAGAGVFQRLSWADFQDGACTGLVAGGSSAETVHPSIYTWPFLVIWASLAMATEFCVYPKREPKKLNIPRMNIQEEIFQRH